MLSVHPFLKILLRRGGDALFRLFQEIHPLAEDYGAGGAHSGAGGLLALLQALFVTEFAFDDLGIPLVPLKLGHFEGARYFAVTAADAARAVPRNGAPLVLLEGLKGTTRHAGGVEAVHTLPFDESKACPLG